MRKFIVHRKLLTTIAVGRAVACSSIEREVCDLNLELVKLDSVANGLPLLLHFFKKSCFARRRNAVDMDPTYSLHALA